MKVSICNLLLAVVVLATTVQGSDVDKNVEQQQVPRRRHLMENAPPELFGAHRFGDIEFPTSNKETRSNLGRKTKTRNMQQYDDTIPEDDEEYDSDPEMKWYEAEDLDYFRYGMLSEFFQWVNPDEIQPGGTTCGFMYPDLGSAPNIVFPVVEVYVCFRFADVQPARKGNLFVHCGGPGSLSDCTMVEPDVVGEATLRDYNILTIDQRGMGRSYPNFAHEECSLNTYFRFEENNTIAGGFLPNPSLWEVDLNNETDIIAGLQPLKSRIINCWTCDSCGFMWSVNQTDGIMRDFHFLEYSGTRQLAEDIERMRYLLNAPYMHVFGISYGTSVFGTYATIFPNSVGLFVLDSTVSPDPNILEYANTRGIGQNDRIEYLIYSCSARNALSEGSCPVSDMRECIGAANTILADLNLAVGSADTRGFLALFLQALYFEPDRAQELCDTAVAGDADSVAQIIQEILPFLFDDGEDAELREYYDPASQPTNENFVYGNDDYPWLMFDFDISTSFVRAQDNAGAQYDEMFFAREVVEYNQRYQGAGTGDPARIFMISYAHSFYWPQSVPLPPMGTPSLTGIISGSLYDSNTPYRWTQQMRAAFPFTNLLTSQSIRHGLVNVGRVDEDYSCNQHIIDYLTNGFVDFVDGTVCGSDFASEGDFLSTFFTRRR